MIGYKTAGVSLVPDHAAYCKHQRSAEYFIDDEMELKVLITREYLHQFAVHSSRIFLTCAIGLIRKLHHLYFFLVVSLLGQSGQESASTLSLGVALTASSAVSCLLLQDGVEWGPDVVAGWDTAATGCSPFPLACESSLHSKSSCKLSRNTHNSSTHNTSC
jgi:hypothetical protein